MKKLFLASALLLAVTASAQFSFGYHAQHNMNSNLRSGWGFGFDGLSSSLFNDFPVHIQLGGGYNVLWAGNERFRNVVLADGGSPQDVTFTNAQTTIFGILRASVPSPSGRFTPYAEIAPGWGFNSATISIHDTKNTENCADYAASQTNAFSIIGGAGLMLKLTDNLALDAGMMWNRNYNRGYMIEMNSVDVSDGITYDMKSAPPTVMTFRFGLRVSMYNSHDCCSVSGCNIQRHHKSCGHTDLPHR